MRTINLLLASVVAVLFTSLAAAETAPKIDNAFVQAAFGKDFTIVQEVGGMVGDMDGDGVEDAVIAARCKNPLLDEAEHSYAVIVRSEPRQLLAQFNQRANVQLVVAGQLCSHVSERHGVSPHHAKQVEAPIGDAR